MIGFLIIGLVVLATELRALFTRRKGPHK